MLNRNSYGNRWVRLALVLALPGCSTVHIDGASQEQIDAMRCEQGFGVLTLSIPNTEKSPLLFRTKGVGMSVSGSRMNIGWLEEQRVILPDQTRCQVVIFAETEKTVTQIIANLEHNKVSLSNICVLGGESNEQDKSSDRPYHDPVDGV